MEREVRLARGHQSVHRDSCGTRREAIEGETFVRCRTGSELPPGTITARSSNSEAVSIGKTEGMKESRGANIGVLLNDAVNGCKNRTEELRQQKLV